LIGSNATLAMMSGIWFGVLRYEVDVLSNWVPSRPARAAHPTRRRRVVCSLAFISASTDPSASSAFYDSVLAPLGAGRVMDFGEVIGYGVEGKPDFWIGLLVAGEPNRENHLAFRAKDRAVLDGFQRGVTTRQEVLDLLGEPTTTRSAGAGSVTCSWDYVHADAHGSIAIMTILTFGADGRLQVKMVSQSGTRR